MFKKALAVIGLMLGAVSANAANAVFEEYGKGCVVSRVWVSSYSATSPTRMDAGATDVSTATTGGVLGANNANNLMPDRKVIQVINAGKALEAWKCAFSSASFTASFNPDFGIPVASSQTITFPMPAVGASGARNEIWCKSMAATISTGVVVQCR